MGFVPAAGNRRLSHCRTPSSMEKDDSCWQTGQNCVSCSISAQLPGRPAAAGGLRSPVRSPMASSRRDARPPVRDGCLVE